MRFAGIAAVVLAMSGCASVQLGDPARSAEIKKFQSRADVGQVYVCRDSRTLGMAIRPDVELDGKIVGTIARNTYVYQEVPAGEHTLVIKSLEHDSKIPFTIAGGEQKYFQTWITFGIVAGRGIIDVMEPAQGKECVLGAELVEAPRL